MEATELRALQSPLKRRYRERPETALVTARAEARLAPDLTCVVSRTGTGPTGERRVPRVPGGAGGDGKRVAGLHPATGGDGTRACSADMMLEALVACAGVTLNSVATALGVELNEAVVRAEGVWDARGTLGVDREVPVGLTDIQLWFELDTEADEATRAKLIELTERYCVIYQTLRNPPELRLHVSPGPRAA